MTWYRVGPAGIPGSLKTDMDTVLNKKFGTSTTYPPNTWPDNVNLLGPLPEKTASGAIANITDGADGVPIKNWLVTLPASLSGYSAVNGVRTGKNLLNPTCVENNYHLSNATGLPSAFNGRIATTTPVSVHGGTVTVSFSTSVSNIYFMYSTFKNGTLIERVSNKNSGNSINLQDADELYICIYGSSDISTSDVSNIQIEYGSIPTQYIAYEAPTTYTASLGRTIYGGTADIVTGEGSETYPTIKISDLTFVKDANCQHTFMCTNLPRKYGFGIYNIFSSAFTTYTSGNSTGSNIASLEVGNDNTIFLNGGSARFYITADSSYDNKSASDFVADFANTLLIYEASTPTPFTFTPITPTPETALGVSNWWADEGDSDVTYRADISLALQALGGGGRGLMGMMMQRPEEEQLTEEDPEEVPEEEAETNER